MKYTPNEFIAKLDEVVIAQADAKKTIAIALRNRWRRTQLNAAISKRITPKNIMLVGSTGVGKTAIIRALADLIDAPMVKVEATKYTQVGYVGGNVNDMIEDLAVEGYRKFNKAKQSKYTNQNDYNAYLSVKKANILMREIEAVVSKELESIRKDFYQCGIAEVEKSTRKKSFYTKKDYEEFKNDYEKNDHKLIDWLFDHKLLIEVFMTGLGYVPSHLTEDIKNSAKRKKVITELRDAIETIFGENELLHSAFQLMLCNLIVPPWERADQNKIVISESHFRAWLKILEEKLDSSMLAFFQTYINYIYHFLNADPFIYDEKKSPKAGEESEVEKESSSVLGFNDHIKYTEEMGIVFIDEIDKLGDSDGSSKENVGKLGVQRDLLAILDGTTVNTSKGAIKTENILFIAAGAFHVAKITDLMPELLGRLPIQVKLEDMNKDILHSILKNENLSPVNQYIQLLSVDSIEVVLAPDVLETIATVADQINRSYRNMGARTLHLVVDKLFSDYAVEVANDSSKRKITITKADILKIKKEYNKLSFNEMLQKYYDLKSKGFKHF